MKISFFKTPKHRVFNYTPVYYDERKEHREKAYMDGSACQICALYRTAGKITESFPQIRKRPFSGSFFNAFFLL